MKQYTITVNGNVYNVTVEEGVNGEVTAPVTSTVVAPKAPVVKKTNGTEGQIKVSAPMPGKILGIKASVGQAVKKGDVLLLLEAMKMENEVVAIEDGIVASINVETGDSVEAGDVLATIN